MLDLVNDFCLIKFRKFNVMIVLHDSAEVNQRPVVGITKWQFSNHEGLWSRKLVSRYK